MCKHNILINKLMELYVCNGVLIYLVLFPSRLF